MKTKILLLISVLFLFLFLSACTTMLTPRVRHSGNKEPKRVLVLPASCTALSGSCSADDTEAIEAMVTSELEFGGIEVVAARKLAVEKRSRKENGGKVNVFGIEVLSGSSLAQVGSLFEDLPPAEQGKILADAGASGVLFVSLQRLAGEGIETRHVVNIRLRGGDDLSQVWVTECSALSALSPNYADATEYATRCALSGVLEHVKNKPAKCATLFCMNDG